MAEKLDLTAATVENVASGVTRTIVSFTVIGMEFRTGHQYDNTTGALSRVAAGSSLDVVIAGPFGAVRKVRLANDQEALTLITALNKANFSTKSLEKRLLEQVVALGGEYAGIISGTPD